MTHFKIFSTRRIFFPPMAGRNSGRSRCGEGACVRKIAKVRPGALGAAAVELAAALCVLLFGRFVNQAERESIMLNKTVASAALIAAAVAASGTPALANVASSVKSVTTENAGAAVQPVYWRHGYGWGHRYGGWGHRYYGGYGGWRRYGYGGYYPGYYGYGYPTGYWGGYPGYGYGWSPGVGVGIAPGFGIGFGY